MDTPILQFGRQLIEANDLDPVYNMLHAVRLPEEKLARWLVAYWTFYHAGVASYMAEQPHPEEYWYEMLKAARNEYATPFGERWPRSAERRHCRGQAAVKCVEYLMHRYGDPCRMLEELRKLNTCKSITKFVKSHYLFGDWIAFKVADMMERVVGIDVEFTADDVFYDSPRKSALWVSEWAFPNEEPTVMRAVEYLRQGLADLKAPPCGSRPLGLQEFETILCKHKSHRSGSYPVGKDIREIAHGLDKWLPYSPIARSLRQCLPTA